MVLTLLFGVIFMIVGATSGRPSFIKISLHLARVVEAPTPTGLCAFDIFDCRGDSQCLQSKLAACQAIALGPSICEANMDARSLQGLIVFLDLMPVGEDIILPMFFRSVVLLRFAQRKVCFANIVNRPYNQ